MSTTRDHNANTQPGERRALPPLISGPHRKRLGYVAFIITVCGFIFGYDSSVMNGALAPLTVEFGLTPFTEGVVTSSLLFGSAVGALAGGPLADAWGRRKTVFLLAFVFLAAALICVFAHNLETLVGGRIFLGLAIGAGGATVPVYLAELAPYEIRGSFAGRNELMIVIGQLTAFVLNAIIGNVWSDMTGVWRIMLVMQVIPSIVLFFGMLRMPESPRWLINKGRSEEALAVLSTLRDPERARAEIADIADIVDEEQQPRMDWRAILKDKWLVRILLIGVAIAVFQQFTGINAVMIYGNSVLMESGFASNTALIANIAPGVIAVICTYTALRIVDRFSRRKTFIVGYICMTVGHVLIGLSSSVLPDGNPAKPFVLLVLIVAFVGAMQLFLNVATWVTLSEIFPLKMRAFGMGVSVCALYVSNTLLVLYFPSVMAALGMSGSFFIFAIINAVAVLFVWKAIPETRGRTLEELEESITTGAIYTKNVRRARR